MNFDQDNDALELHAEMEENNSIREHGTPTHGTPTHIMEREVIGSGSQQEVMTINVPNVNQPQITPQMAPRPMPIQQFGQQFGKPYFQNHHYMQTPPVVMNSQETNNMNLMLQNFKQMLDKQNNTINSLEEIFLKIHRQVNKLMAVPATPDEWKLNHVFIDQFHNQWTSRSDTVTFENHRTKISLASVDTVTGSNKKVRSWVIKDSDLLRSMN